MGGDVPPQDSRMLALRLYGRRRRVRCDLLWNWHHWLRECGLETLFCVIRQRRAQQSASVLADFRHYLNDTVAGVAYTSLLPRDVPLTRCLHLLGCDRHQWLALGEGWSGSMLDAKVIW